MALSQLSGKPSKERLCNQRDLWSCLGEEKKDGTLRNDLFCQAVVEVTGPGAIPASAGYPQCPQPMHHSGSLAKSSSWRLHPPAHLPWAVLRGDGSNTMWRSRTP